MFVLLNYSTMLKIDIPFDLALEIIAGAFTVVCFVLAGIIHMIYKLRERTDRIELIIDSEDEDPLKGWPKKDIA